MLRAIGSGSPMLAVLIGFLAVMLAFRFLAQVKSRTVRTSVSSDDAVPIFSGRAGHSASPVDDWEPIGNVIADHLRLRTILHYARPSGTIDIVETEIIRLHGVLSQQGIQIGSLIETGHGRRNAKRIFQFYRIKAVEDPVTHEIYVNDFDKALWLIRSAGLIPS
ncbi:Hypothetical protein HVPorG_03617a [Roseomonas mucosa]|uniref:hypothetical protein n=1 Tax=Roseomonas mucosa TaxID=207340 RepID=UPI002207A515|nr:hypothetical protein [Roseomonas mucosa]QDJ08888.1 Hypothetical protein HVPorG_03617a [Roseomonas mucosa]